MINETELIKELKKYNFREIFTENLNTDEKLYIFNNAEKIIGSIGGGMSNLLFSQKKTKSFIIVSPYFLEVNYRFRYSLENTDFRYFDETIIYKKENCKYSNYTRVIVKNKNNKYNGKIGEIINFEKNKYKINISNNDIAGFNNKMSFVEVLFNENEIEALDRGLNSPYKYNFDNLIKNIIN